MYCKYCGKPNDNNGCFCKHCGRKLIDEPKPSRNENVSTSKSINKTSEPAAKSSNNRLLKAFLCSLAISLALTIGYAIFRYGDSLPCDDNRSWGGSVYDPAILNVLDKDYLTSVRQEEYKSGIINTALLTFPISFGIIFFLGKLKKK